MITLLMTYCTHPHSTQEPPPPTFAAQPMDLYPISVIGYFYKMFLDYICSYGGKRKGECVMCGFMLCMQVCCGNEAMNPIVICN